MLREAVNLLHPLLASGTVLEGSFRWICTSMVPLKGFHSMGRTELPVFQCLLDMRHHMQQLQQHCLELWTRRIATPGTSCQDYFLVGYRPRHPEGGAPGRPYKIVHVQCLWAMGAVRPRQPPATKCRPVPCHRFPIHQQPQCEQCRLVRRVVAHCCARGHVGHLVAMATASSRVPRAGLPPRDLPSQPLAKRPCISLAAVGQADARGWIAAHPARQLGAAKCSAPCPGWGSTLPSLDPTGTSVGGRGHP